MDPHSELQVIQDFPVTEGRVRGISFGILCDTDAEKLAAVQIESANQVTDPALGVPNLSNHCVTCGAKKMRKAEGALDSLCEGHFGFVKFPYTILNPYFLPEIAQLLNKICPGCKSMLPNKAKSRKALSMRQESKTCKYCDGRSKEYPAMKFKVSPKEMFGKTAIVAEVSETSHSGRMASGYWDIIPPDPHEEQSTSKFRRLLTHAQVYNILKDLDPGHLDLIPKRKNSIFLNSFLVSPNCHRLTEFGQHITFDARTKLYRKLPDFKGTANELSTRVLDLIKASRVRSDKSSVMNSYMSSSDAPMTGLKFIKEILLGKRNNHAFRMVVVGDPNVKLDEIGVPCRIAEKLRVSEHVNRYNKENMERYLDLMIFGEGDVCVRRRGSLVRLSLGDTLKEGDVLYRPLVDGDIVLVNRPPSIHQHSFVALRVKILPIISVLSINPLICSPLRGDFDGDCLHGYVPQSINSRIELEELVALNNQLIDGQTGRNLLSLTHDSLTAANLILGDGVTLSKVEMQQLQMSCPQKLLSPALLKSLSSNMPFWTGKQLFSLFLPLSFDYAFPSHGVCISKGEILTSSDSSSWMREADENLFYHLVKQCKDEFLDFLFAAQEVLCEWLSTRGLSVSLADLYLASDLYFRENLMDEVFCGLQEAELLSDISCLMVDYNEEFLIENSEENKSNVEIGRECMSICQQTSAALSQASVSSFKHVFRDIQHLAFQYARKDNSFLAMLKAGSKGNSLKLAQQSMCLGLQHSSVPLSFRIPHQLSCGTWNDYKVSLYGVPGVKDHSTYIPLAVIRNSFLTGLNPLECFVHSLTSRDGSFSGHADVSGSLHRKLMFFMRDLLIAYDGTVRSAYGNTIVQFTYGTQGTSNSCNSNDEDGGGNRYRQDLMGGHPVGSLAACALTEAAYSALDQPVSALESSPLLNLKKVLECGVKKSSGNRSATLFLSKKVGRSPNGFEYGALELKSHLERVPFSEIVSAVTISYCTETGEHSHTSPWICRFHLPKQVLKRKRLSVEAIIDALKMNNLRGKRTMKYLQHMKISSEDCCPAVKQQQLDAELGIIVSLTDSSRNSSLQLEILRDMIIPFLLRTIVKGFHDFKKVDILWRQWPNGSKFSKGVLGELYLQVFMSETCDKSKFWSTLVDSCLPLMTLIDWERSHPDDINDLTLAYGIDVGWQHFVSSLDSAVRETGKSMLSEHLVLTADCLSATGEFVALNGKGISQQRKEFSVACPFSQACFSNPGDCFIKAAKAGVTDDLQGSMDALCWGRTPSIGTGAHFDIMYSGKDHQPIKSVNVYHELASNKKEVPTVKVPMDIELSCKSLARELFKYDDSTAKIRKGLLQPETRLRNVFSVNDIQRISQTLKRLLFEYDIDSPLSEVDKAVAMKALLFHPRRSEKLGKGAIEIKVGYHPQHENSRCFLLVRKDDTVEDFSYHKCIHHAYQLIAPKKAGEYKSKWLSASRKIDEVVNGPPPKS